MAAVYKAVPLSATCHVVLTFMRRGYIWAASLTGMEVALFLLTEMGHLTGVRTYITTEIENLKKRPRMQDK
jgi:hypothetical protein